MTTTHADRTAALVAAAKSKSTRKTADAEQAIRRLLKRGERVTFQAVQREAGVSHAFLYNHAELRPRIERLRANARPVDAATAPDSDNNLIHTLSQQITELKKQHRTEVRALRDALEQAHGENLDLRRQLTRQGTATNHIASIAETS
ncbi:transposase [Rhodococcus sp. SC4]|nr:transposase [Rhodococcus sp. SC4]